MGIGDRLRRVLGGPTPRKLEITVPLLSQVTGAPLRFDGYYILRQYDFDIRRARQYTQTDGYGRELVELFVDSVVGATGVRTLWGDDYVQEQWEKWRPNATREHERIDEVQRDMVRGLIRDGESFFQILGDPEGLYLKTIDPVDIPLQGGGPYERTGPRSRTAQGIVFDDMGRPVEYIISPPYGYAYEYTPPELIKRLPAKQVIHTYYEVFPGQIRGISWLRPVLLPLMQLQDFEKDFATMVATAAKLPGYFTANEALQLPFDPSELEGEDDDDDDPDSASNITALQRRWLEQVMNADPATRPRLPEGTEWHSVDISSAVNGQLYEANRKGLLARIARGLGISYNSLSGDLGEANYSSLRLGQIENHAQYRRVQRLLIGFSERVAKEWLEYMRLRDARIDAMGDTLNPEFDAPTFDFIDPLKEAATAKTLVELKIRSPQQLIRENGENPERTLEEIIIWEAKEKELREKYGLSPSPTAPSGDGDDGGEPPTPPSDDDEPDGEEEDEDTEDEDDDEWRGIDILKI